jgi:hypothetical protein
MSFKEKRNSDFFLRPRFSIDLQENATQLFERVANALKKEDCNFKSSVSDGHFFVDVAEKESHFWSPQLQFEIVELDENSSAIKGLFGPKPQVWTLFMFVHFIVGTAFLCFAIMTYVKYTLEESLFFPVVMLIVLPLVWMLLYLLGNVGKETGKHQMKKLHDFLIEIIES